MKVEVLDRQVYNITIASTGTNDTNCTTLLFGVADGLALYGDRYVEVVFVLLFLVIWVISVVFFLNKWNSLRLMQQVGANTMYAPRNLDTITVVKQAKESVIYCK